MATRNPPTTITIDNDNTTNPPLYLIRLSHTHETFRLPELKSLASYLHIPLEVVSYSPDSPFCIVSFSPVSPSSSSASTATQPQTNNGDHNDTHEIAKHFLSRSILSKAIYQLYAVSPDYPTLHNRIKSLPSSTWTGFENVSFKFSVDSFRGKRSVAEQRGIVEGFGYLPFKGPIRMKGAQEEFVVFEEWERLSVEEQRVVNNGLGGNASLSGQDGEEDRCPTTNTNINMNIKPDMSMGAEPGTTIDATDVSHPTSVIVALPKTRKPKQIYFARYIASSQRHLIEKHDLKKRPYISTTSMDAELALLTAILAQCGPGRLVLDPFVGTGGFMVAAAELGAVTLGSDIDGRSFRGKGAGMKKGVLANFERYGIVSRFGDCLTGDLTNSPLRVAGRYGRGKRWLDAVVCDPPYGVREGLKVLGKRGHGSTACDNDGLESTSLTESNGVEEGQDMAASSLPSAKSGPILINGVPSHTLPGFIAPKRPYSFDRMLGDIIDFSARTLVNGGRLAFWMPCANEAEEEFGIPTDPKGLLILQHVCVQDFNRWSRRLLVYERMPGEVIEEDRLGSANGGRKAVVNGAGSGHHADDLNQFRRMYFQGFNRGIETIKNENG